MRAWLTYRRFGVILQEEFRPLAETQAFTFANHLQNVAIPGLGICNLLTAETTRC
jgi:hypothetical protein